MHNKKQTAILEQAFELMNNPLYIPTKSMTTVRIDSDVLMWLRSTGKGWQTRINAILRREMIIAAQQERNKK